AFCAKTVLCCQKYGQLAHIPKVKRDLRKWSQWLLENLDRRTVAKTKLDNGVDVSTVFLGQDIHMGRYDNPRLFETMIFGGAQDNELWRTTSWDEAKETHAMVVAAQIANNATVLIHSDGYAVTTNDGEEQ
ncbi:hypothetical protein, partial [Kistimonas scapharcae]|uniref:hypothetical protein n=1 Tax=Kistimonas scapharcae TaxID=1036133 RepID=UPI003CD0BF27